MALELANARHVRDGIYPLLVVEINGREIRLGTEWKPTLRAAGLIYVDDDLGLPDRTIPTLDGDGRRVTVRGCTDDRRLVELYRRFWEAGSFAPGPVTIPD